MHEAIDNINRTKILDVTNRLLNAIKHMNEKTQNTLKHFINNWTE